MPSATEELQTQLDKAEEEKAAAIQRAETAEAELAKANQEGEDGGPFKRSKGGTNEDGDEQTARKSEDEKAALAKAMADLPAEARAAIEKAEADRVALADRLEKAEASVQRAEAAATVEREARVTKEYIAKAADFEGLPIEATEFGPVLKAVDEKLDKAEAEAIHTLLKAADEIAKESALLKELGKGGAPVAGDALAKLQHKAEEIRKADSSLSAEQALDKAMKEDPELQRQYLNEVR